MRQEPATVGRPARPAQLHRAEGHRHRELLGVPGRSLQGHSSTSSSTRGKDATDANGAARGRLHQARRRLAHVQTGPDPDGAGADPAPIVDLDFATAAAAGRAAR